ncbi:Type III restriction-modification system methylation subunit [Hyphomicrobiales bacterium]|nr:site-specific DNA-methyltransferase [Planctomycetales bacterium]CAH1686604.1 Type III restriction-modification system methylation subunit [Hyphomicrobiales bacterium]
MEKLKMRTRSLSQEQIKAIKDVFPSCVREAYFEATGEKRLLVDFDELRQELSDQIVDGPQERFRLDWPGKREALAMANMPIEKTLLPCREESVNFEATQNLFLEGDNFEALKIIEETFLGSVRMIYIDPPYNTGRNLIYRNDYSEKSADFLERSGQISGEGGRLVANPETSGRFHSDWLSMMYQRLKVAKNILAKDGVLVCAIDENEFGTLSVLMKEVFSGAAWEHAYVSVIHNPRGQQGTNFSYINEYLIFVYPSGTKSIGDRKIREEDVNWSQFRNWGGESERTDAKNCFYPVLVQDEKIIGFGDVCPDDFHPEQTEWRDGVAYVYPIDNSGTERKWRYARQSVEEIASMLRAKRSGDGYQIEIGKTFGLYRSVWTDKRYDSNEYGTKLVNSLVEGSGFTFPKSLWAVYDPIEAVTGNHKDAIILDFFAGSATTAHAVMQLNANDGGNRRFIMVQVPEAIDSSLPPYKRGFTTIAEISKERIRRAGGKLLEGECHPDWNRDVGFRVLKVDTSNMKDVYYRPDELKQSDLLDMVDNVKDGRTAEDLLFQVLLDWGVDLTLPIRRETVQGKTVFFVDDNALVACFERGITEDLVKELAGHEPLRVVFRDNGFVSDAVKINVEQIFRQLSPTTDVKSI